MSLIGEDASTETVPEVRLLAAEDVAAGLVSLLIYLVSMVWIDRFVVGDGIYRYAWRRDVFLLFREDRVGWLLGCSRVSSTPICTRFVHGTVVPTVERPAMRLFRKVEPSDTRLCNWRR